MINKFEGRYRFLSNFYPCEIEHQGIKYPSVENFYVAMKVNDQQLINGKYYINYSFIVPNQLDGAYNPENMHVLLYVYDKATFEIYQVIKQKIIN